MINVIADGMGSCIYLDNEGIDDMIHYLTYLREKNETTYDLVEGNGLIFLTILVFYPGIS